MSFTERFDAAAARMDELKAKLEKASEEVKESWSQGVANFKSDMAVTRESIEEIAEENEARKQAKKDERREKAENVRDTVRESFAEGAENYKSDMEVLRESLREVAAGLDEQNEAVEAKKEAKVDEARAKLEETANRIYEVGQAFERADQEELILDLLAYAEECQAVADAMTDEAELALKAAAEQIAIYNEKFGE